MGQRTTARRNRSASIWTPANINAADEVRAFTMAALAADLGVGRTLEAPMGDRAGEEEVAHTWYTRPVLFVADIGRSIRFYTEGLGFRKAWHEADGKGTVCQVDRGGCEIILCEHDTRRDKARLFVSLTREAIAALRREIIERSIPSKMSWWGYDVIQIDDPDGNELLFPVSSE